MKDLKHYESLRYTIVLRKDDEGDVVARIEELPGCSAHGESQSEALENLAEAKALWITDCLERQQPVPEPQDDSELPSGKWVQRVPRNLHKRLAALAKEEDVSLNQLVTSFLAEAVGQRSPARQRSMVAPLVQQHSVVFNVQDVYRPEEISLYTATAPQFVGPDALVGATFAQFRKPTFGGGKPDA